MRRLATALIAAGALAAPAAAQAAPVPTPVARHAIRHWWRDRWMPRPACREQRHGDLCVLRIPAARFDCSGPFCGDVHGHDDKLVWVSRQADGRVRVTDIGDRLDVEVG